MCSWGEIQYKVLRNQSTNWPIHSTLSSNKPTCCQIQCGRNSCVVMREKPKGFWKILEKCAQNSTFVVDISKLSSPKDISGDDNGVYRRPSTVSQKMKGDKIQAARQTGEHDYIVRQRYYRQRRDNHILQSGVWTIWQRRQTATLQYAAIPFSDNVHKKLEYTAHGN